MKNTIGKIYFACFFVKIKRAIQMLPLLTAAKYANNK